MYGKVRLWHVKNLVISRSGDYGRLSETISTIVFLCLMLLIRFWFGNRESGLKTADWTKFGYIPVFSMIVIMALSMTFWDQTTAGGNIRLAAIAGFAVLNICMFYMIGNILEKDRQMQRLTLLQERTQNQMEMYQSMQKNYEQQKKYLHDYKNQLNCIQGMISARKYEETLEYISGLTGSLRKNADYVNTNHAVVNVILNQKYQEALDHGITMVMSVNDLSALSMKEEDVVTLLVNLLDNAIEACGKLESNKVIQFKMILEDGGLILAIRNPVDRPVQIRNNKVRTSKPDPANHGIGLLNVESVIQKNHGTKVLKCEDGWFCFSAMFSQ